MLFRGFDQRLGVASLLLLPVVLGVGDIARKLDFGQLALGLVDAIEILAALRKLHIGLGLADFELGLAVLRVGHRDVAIGDGEIGLRLVQLLFGLVDLVLGAEHALLLRDRDISQEHVVDAVLRTAATTGPRRQVANRMLGIQVRMTPPKFSDPTRIGPRRGGPALPPIAK